MIRDAQCKNYACKVVQNGMSRWRQTGNGVGSARPELCLGRVSRRADLAGAAALLGISSARSQHPQF